MRNGTSPVAVIAVLLLSLGGDRGLEPPRGGRDRLHRREQPEAGAGEHDRAEDLLPRGADLARQPRVPLDPGRVPEDHGAHEPDQLVGAPVGRRQRVELAHPRVLRLVQGREDIVQRRLEREVPVVVFHQAGVNTGTVTSSVSSRYATTSGMPTSSRSGSQSTTFVIRRGPSARSTTAATYGIRSENGGRSLWCTTDHVYNAARPLAASQRTAGLQHRGQNGRG